MDSVFDELPETPRKFKYAITSCNLCTTVVDGKVVRIKDAHLRLEEHLMRGGLYEDFEPPTEYEPFE